MNTVLLNDNTVYAGARRRLWERVKINYSARVHCNKGTRQQNHKCGVLFLIVSEQQQNSMVERNKTYQALNTL